MFTLSAPAVKRVTRGRAPPYAEDEGRDMSLTTHSGTPQPPLPGAHGPLQAAGAWLQTVLRMFRKLVGGAPLYPGGPTAAQLSEESKKLRRVPGIVFADGPIGRRARIAGTGIEVFEIIDTYRAVGEDRVRLAEHFDWLRPEQLAAALAYAQAFPEEIELQLRQEEALERSYRRAQPAL